jgi:hypothetical protein
MKYFYVIFLKVSLLIDISCVFCTNISGYCGSPNIPYNAKITPSQQLPYVDGDKVECKCQNEFIDFKQVRECQKGKWIGKEFLCGNEVIFLF